MSYTAGAVVRSTVTFVPASGTTDIANVTAVATSAEGATTSLTPVAGTANVYYADINIPDTAITGPWSVRWECSGPDIVFEDSFDVVASTVFSP